jgi:hypothetical protein
MILREMKINQNSNLGLTSPFEGGMRGMII